MKKLSFFAVVLLLLSSTLLLASCAGEVTAYSPSSRISIVYSELDSTTADRVAYNKVVGAIKEHIGSNCRNITDDLRQTNFEIVVGDSNREASRLAKEYLASNTPLDGDAESYVFYYKDSTIAIMASSEFAMEIAAEVFVSRYLDSDTLVIKSDMLEFKLFSKTAYLAEQDAKIEAENEEKWEHRWDELRAVVGNDATAAVQRLYNFWGTEWLEWAAGLYDPDIGGFYYSASARDYIGFLPDIESTAQILGLFKTFGLCDWYDGYWGAAFPADFREKLGTFVQGLQSETDGYFYHPQWGTSIGTAAKGRHLDQGLFILGVAGMTPLYRSPLDTATAMSGISEVITAFMDTDEHKSSVVFTASTLPDYMKSEEAMLAYLEEQRDIYTDDNGLFNSYSFGHLLSSQNSQMKAAGIIDFVCDYLDALQIPETGLWEPITDNPDSGYNALSGVIKIGAVYGSAGRAFANADKMVDTAIEVILNDRPAAHVCYIFNPIGAFAKIISCMKATGIDVTTARQKVYHNLTAMLDATMGKLERFKKELDSYSYLPDRSDPASQGLRMSLGMPEGDVNATAVCIEYIGGALFDLLGVDPVPMFKYSDFKWFCQQISESGAPVKGNLVLETLDFEDGDIPARVILPDIADLEVEVVDDGREDGEDGSALWIHNGGSKSAVFAITADTTIEDKCFSVELDMKFVSSSSRGYCYSLYLHSDSKRRTGFELQFNVLGDGTVSVHECSYTPGNQYSEAIFTVNMDEWFNLKIEYYPISSTEMRAKVYKNGTCIFISDTPHYNVYSPGVVYNNMNRVYLNCFRTNDSVIMLDNIDCYHDPAKEFSDSDYLVPSTVNHVK